MISAWDIYWVMQLDGIKNALGFLTFAAFVVSGVTLVIGSVNGHACPEEWHSPDYKAKAERSLARAPVVFSVGKRVIALAVFLSIITALVPTTKTAAMMLVIPAVANNETIQNEAGELYGIAKDALRELAKPDQPAVKQATAETE